MKWTAKDISDDAYFAVGDVFKGMDEAIDRHKDLVISASTLKAQYETNLYFWLMSGGFQVSEDLQEIFDLGSAFHCHVLESKHFTERYRVSDTIDASDERVRIGLTEYKFIEQATIEVSKKYPYLMNDENAEIAIFGEIDGVPVKCKIDKLHITAVGGRFTHVEIIDLKGVWFDPFKQKKSASKDRWELRKKLSSTGYDLQAYFYKKLVEAWLESIGQSCPVTFSLVVASKETTKVQKFRVGDEMLLTGEEKFNSVWSHVVDFVTHGKSALVDEEVL